MTTTEVMNKVQLIDGVFTPSEASDLINTLIREKVNFHNLHRLSMCEGNMNSDTSFDDGRVSELLKEKDAFKAIYHEAKLARKKLKINGILDVEIID